MLLQPPLLPPPDSFTGSQDEVSFSATYLTLRKPAGLSRRVGARKKRAVSGLGQTQAPPMGRCRQFFQKSVI